MLAQRVQYVASIAMHVEGMFSQHQAIQACAPAGPTSEYTVTICAGGSMLALHSPADRAFMSRAGGSMLALHGSARIECAYAAIPRRVRIKN